MNMDDLKPFCSIGAFRPWLNTPFSRDKYTYATNGHVLVRVPRLSYVDENPKAPPAEKVIDPIEFLPLVPFVCREIPPPETQECFECDGGNPVHNCPTCSCVCEECDGTNSVEVQLSISIKCAIFDAKYIRLIQELPNCLFPENPSKNEPTRFKFDGGEGLLIPMTRRGDKHMKEDGSIIEISDGEN